MRFTPLQINKDNERYYSSDYMQGFKDGVKRQCEADSKIKRGEWTNDKNDMPCCSKCGYIPQFDRALDDYEYSNFCPNCGADMRGDDK